MTGGGKTPEDHYAAGMAHSAQADAAFSVGQLYEAHTWASLAQVQFSASLAANAIRTHDDLMAMLRQEVSLHVGPTNKAADEPDGSDG